MMGAMNVLRLQQQIGKRQREARLDRVDVRRVDGRGGRHRDGNVVHCDPFPQLPATVPVIETHLDQTADGAHPRVGE